MNVRDSIFHILYLCGKNQIKSQVKSLVNSVQRRHQAKYSWDTNVLHSTLKSNVFLQIEQHFFKKLLKTHPKRKVLDAPV